jgi:hypothetical protein
MTAGHVALTAPSAWYCNGVSGFCLTNSAVSPSGASPENQRMNSPVVVIL